MLSGNYEKTNKNSVSNTHVTDCQNWYALHTLTGYESHLVSKLQFLYGDIFRLYLPRREVIHTVTGIDSRVSLPLYPGYIFVHEKIDEIARNLELCRTGIFARPVSAEGKYLRIRECEMKFLFDIAGENGKIDISKGIIDEGNAVRIISGPLENLTGRILFINRKKKKAKVRMEMMNRILDVSLGLEIVDIDNNRDTGF